MPSTLSMRQQSSSRRPASALDQRANQRWEHLNRPCSPVSPPDRIAIESPEFWPPFRLPGVCGGIRPRGSGRDGLRRLLGGAGRTASASAAQTALGQIVLASRGPGGVRALGVDGDEAVFGTHGGQQGQVTLDLTPDAAERDSEHTLPPLEQVHYLIRGGAFVDANPVA